MTPGLVIFTGLQASGKTSFYRERFAATHVHISKDAWPNARNREARQRRLIDEHLRAGRSVVVDNTNPTAAEREPLIAIGRALRARISIYVFVTTVEDALRRNAGRQGPARIADVGIYSVAKRLVLPGDAEDYDERFEVRLSEGGFRVDLSRMRRKLEERGLVLRRVEPRDLDALVAIHADPRTNEHNRAGPLPDAAAGHLLLERWTLDWTARGIGYWAVDADADGLGTIGFAGVRHLQLDGYTGGSGDRVVFNLYYRFAPTAWGRGYATAVAAAALASAIEYDASTPVIARMQPSNRSSERVALRVGFRHVGRDAAGRLVLADRELPAGLLGSLPVGS